MAKLLVVDDEPNVLYSLQRSLQSESLDVVTADTGKKGLEQVHSQHPDGVIVDVRLPDMSGLELYDRIRQIDPRLPVIVITAYAATETAIEAMKRGAFDYLLKPVDLHQLRDVVERAIETGRLSRVPTVLDEPEETRLEGDRIVGRSAAMQEVYKAIGRVAPQDVTVLIQGESGTGKELVARAIYQHSRRCQGPFLAINCAAIPEALLESELFGHERGAFTGADRRRIGKFEQASGGTIFLDEIGDMSPATQAKVLRLLQEQRFEHVGGSETIQTDVRVIAATNQNLEDMVAAGRFRHDLYYRLNVFSIRLPPLRERLDDLPLLVQHFLKQLNPQLGRHVHTLAPEALHALSQQPWPGNVRELQSTIKYALVHAAGDVLTTDYLPDNLRNPNSVTGQSPLASGGALEIAGFVKRMLASGQPEVYHSVHSAVDRILLDEVLRHVKGNQVEAAEILGVSRNTLRSRLRSLGLTVEKQVTPGPDHTAE